MASSIITDSALRGLNHHGEQISGDNFIYRQIVAGRRHVAVLSDGLGSGVKANIMSTFTSTMLLNFISSHENIVQAADMILRMLPENKSYGAGYATFSIADIDTATGDISIVQYDSPPAIIIRNGDQSTPEWKTWEVVREKGRSITLRTTRFMLSDGDRIIMVSDGITQSGQHSGTFKFGWGEEQLRQFATYLTDVNSRITASDLAAQIVSKANINDAHKPADDMSCAVLHIRKPRSMMLVSCPPAIAEEYPRLTSIVSGFQGEKVICGHPVAQIIARESGLHLERNELYTDALETPQYRLKGFSVVTEGMIVPNRVLDMLEHTAQGYDTRKSGVPGRLFKMLTQHDHIEMIIGLRRTISTDPAASDEFELRRNILRRIASLLQDKFGKQVDITYL